MTVPPPPRLEDLPAGTQLIAGLGVATVMPDLDFETYSAAGHVWDDELERWTGPHNAPAGKKGLEVVGSAVYTEDPSCEVLSLAYDLKDGRGRRHWRPGQAPPLDLFTHIVHQQPIEAWNVSFERWVWENVCVPRMFWPPVNPSQWRCAMAKARAHSLPGSLDKVGEVLALPVRKDPDGARLLRKFSVPRNPTQKDARQSIRPEEDLEDGPKLYSYNVTDIAAEAAASSVIPDLSPAELQYWRDDQTINRRGMQIDLDGAHNCIEIIEQAHRRYGDELQSIAGCRPSEVQQLKDWLRTHGVHLDSLDENAVEMAMKWDLPPEARRALQIRAAVGSASVKKVFAMRNQASLAGRLHNLYIYHGARTGRPTGNGVQAANLPKAGPNVYLCECGRHHGAHTMWCHWCGKVTIRGPKAALEWSPEAAVDALEAISQRSLDWLEVLFGDAMLTIAGCLRALFIAKPGHELISSDYTAIEGVVIACLAGEQWRIDAYANDEPMYLLSAERMFGTSVAEMKAYAKEHGKHHPLRQKGKGGELGLGFGGWVNALRQFGVDGSDDELKDTVLKWRAASPALEWFWGGQTKGKANAIRQSGSRWDKTPEYFGLEGMAVQAALNPGVDFAVTRLNGTPSGISYLVRGDVLYAKMPSGGLITYHRPRLEQSEQTWRGLSLSYEGWNTNPKSGPIGWIRMNTYSGKLAENVTQKAARDIQMAAIHRCETSGYSVVMHTYDEIVSEVPGGCGNVRELEALMTEPLPWTQGWPIKAAGGWRDVRYGKR